MQCIGRNIMSTAFERWIRHRMSCLRLSKPAICQVLLHTLISMALKGSTPRIRKVTLHWIMRCEFTAAIFTIVDTHATSSSISAHNRPPRDAKILSKIMSFEIMFNNNVDRIHKMLARGYTFDLTDKRIDSVFQRATLLGDQAIVVQLIEAGYNQKDQIFLRKIYYNLSQKEDVEMLELLIEQGFEIRAMDSTLAQRCFSAAAQQRSMKMMRFWLDHGVEADRAIPPCARECLVQR